MVPALAGCDLTRLTAKQTADLFGRATPAIESYWDYDTVGDSMPGNIMQLEGVHHVIPENKSLLMQLIQAYTSYAYGWIEDRAEVADAAGDMDRAAALRKRARLMYTRARDLARYRISLDEDGFDQAWHAGLPTFEKWLRDHFDDADDAPMLLWAGYSWGSAINVNREDFSAIADLPFAVALVQRSVDLDPGYYNAAGLTFLGASKTAALGADLPAAKALFERALTITHRKSLIIQVNYRPPVGGQGPGQGPVPPAVARGPRRSGQFTNALVGPDCAAACAALSPAGRRPLPLGGAGLANAAETLYVPGLSAVNLQCLGASQPRRVRATGQLSEPGRQR